MRVTPWGIATFGHMERVCTPTRRPSVGSGWCCVGVVGSLVGHSAVSDHRLVVVRFPCRVRVDGLARRMRRAVIQDDVSKAVVRRDLELCEDMADPAERHEARLVAARCACGHVSDAAALRAGKASPSALAEAALAALRLHRDGRCQQAAASVAAAPGFPPTAVVDGHVVPHVRLHLLARWLEQTCSAEAAVLPRSDAPELQKAARRRQLRLTH